MHIHKAMKRMLLIAVTGLVALPLAAQEQEEHVVRRGRHKAAVVQVVEKEKKHIDVKWYNTLSISAMYGSLGYTEVWGFNENHILLDSPRQEYDAVTATLGYERLACFGVFYIGPGIRAYFSPTGLYGGDAHLRARLEAHKFMGFKGKVHPYIDAMGGYRYTMVSLPQAALYEYTHDYEQSTGSIRSEIYGGHLIDSHSRYKGSFSSLSFSLGLGFNFELGKHTALSIGYHASMLPYIETLFAPSHSSIVSVYNENWSSKHMFGPTEQIIGRKLQHGIEISFLF